MVFQYRFNWYQHFHAINRVKIVFEIGTNEQFV